MNFFFIQMRKTRARGNNGDGSMDVNNFLCLMYADMYLLKMDSDRLKDIYVNEIEIEDFLKRKLM